jgi:hypothetical protein
MKKAAVDSIPRQAVLKPAHAVYRLQNQRYSIGDRVVMVKDSGSVPLSAKGVVIGINARALDVVWDDSFMSGSTLGDRFVTRPDRSTGITLTSIAFQVFSVSGSNDRISLLCESQQPSSGHFNELAGTPTIASECWTASWCHSVATALVSVGVTSKQWVGCFVCDE